ncbi:GGDEF domain-containing protein [Bradyrhizobium manausense]|uniref:GGDEF domain-containing protein n=1 Tax=Bradyrhizobium manausense TaxID=989370 RepID=UPI001BAA68A4|nr:GGDEF domain-containing protein [Bradyrhizobium manausense]MBR0825190.1 GGDEF domain-containing protein [Bradyrhizobium manausense]
MRKPKRAKAARKLAKSPAKSPARSLARSLAKTPPKGRKAGKTRSRVAAKAVHKTRPNGVKPDDTRATIRNLRTKLTQALRRIDELEAAADTDFLLGIPNRRGFERELHRAIAYMKRYRASGALIVLDVDRLKPINDAFGHAAGDEVLKTIVATLTRQVRSSDVVGRLGGDEFALLLWNLSATDAKAKAVTFEEAIDELSFTFRGQSMNAGASAGVALLGSHAEAGRALEEADAAMYVRKAQRRHEPRIRIVAG